MKVFSAAVAAAASSGIRAAAVEVFDSPEFADVLLPEVAHVFGVNYAVHSTFEDLKIHPEDVHVLPKAPNLEDALAALSGPPLTRQAEARAAELVASLAPSVELYPRLRASNPVSFVPIDLAPWRYDNVPYIIFNSIIYGLLLPLGLYGLRNAKSPEFIKKLLPVAAFFLGHNLASIVLQNILSFRGLLAVPVCACFGILAMLYAFKRADTFPMWNAPMAGCPMFTELEKEPFGYVACDRIFILVVANLTYHAISSILPYHFGLVGFVTSNRMVAGLLYFLYLVVVACFVRQQLCAYGDLITKQRIVFSLVCSYISICGITFFLNVISVYIGFGDFIAFDPPVFFSTATVYELNLGTILATLAFFGMWGASYQEIKAMEDQKKVIASTSSLAVATFEESSKELAKTLEGFKTKGLLK